MKDLRCVRHCVTLRGYRVSEGVHSLVWKVWGQLNRSVLDPRASRAHVCVCLVPCCHPAWGAVLGTQEARRCFQRTHPCVTCPRNVLEGGGGGEEGAHGSVYDTSGRRDIPGRTYW